MFFKLDIPLISVPSLVFLYLQCNYAFICSEASYGCVSLCPKKRAHQHRTAARFPSGWIAVLGALLLLVLADLDDLESVMARVEWTTLVFFAALFVVMESLNELQLLWYIGQRTQAWISALQPQSQSPVAIMIVTWVSAFASSLMDNIPFTTAMVKVVVALGPMDVRPLVYALAWGACLGGNGTLIGASANVVCAGVAEQHGHRFTFFDFFK